MTNKYYIAPFHPKEWKESQSHLRIDPKVYKDQLVEKWPGIEFPTPFSGHSLAWIIQGRGEGRISGSLQDNGQRNVSTVLTQLPLEFCVVRACQEVA